MINRVRVRLRGWVIRRGCGENTGLELFCRKSQRNGGGEPEGPLQEISMRRDRRRFQPEILPVLVVRTVTHQPAFSSGL